MIKINVIAVGKVKEDYFVKALAEYSKRLSRFCTFTITEVSEENYSKQDDGLVDKIKRKEGENILPHLKGYVMATAIEGKKTDSQGFAKLIQSLIDQGKGEITFVIGGSYGLCDQVKQRADRLVSFSDMTFPHTFFRVMLLEQIYRAFCINNGVSYHK